MDFAWSHALFTTVSRTRVEPQAASRSVVTDSVAIDGCARLCAQWCGFSFLLTFRAHLPKTRQHAVGVPYVPRVLQALKLFRHFQMADFLGLGCKTVGVTPVLLRSCFALALFFVFW